MCFKHDNHPALGDLRIPVCEKLTQSLPSGERRRRREERAERARLEEEAEEEWARNEVSGTAQALEVRSRLESLGLYLWHAGAAVQLQMPEVEQSFQGFLVSNTTEARENNDYNWDLSWDGVEAMFEYEEPEPQHARIDPQRVVRVKAWLATEDGTRRKEKAAAKAPAHPRRQKRADVASSRRLLAEARLLRKARRAARQQKQRI